MDENKLMKPLFQNGMFNKEGKRIRAKHFKTITDGKDSFSLWISANGPDKDYTSNEKDQYYLHLEHGEYIVNTGLTEQNLEDKAREVLINREFYGGSFEGRQEFFQNNFYKGRTYEEYRPLVKAQAEKEDAFIRDHAGLEAMMTVEIIKTHIGAAIKRYVNARDNGGNHADFVGALFLDELDKCVELAAELGKKREEEEREKERQREAAAQKEREEEEAENNRLMQEAEKAFIDGGTVKDGETIMRLAEKYGVNVPIRTRGWILNSLAECTLTEGGNVSYKYWRKTKNAKGSQTAFDVLSKLQAAIKEAA